MKVVEIFGSIDGEGKRTGQLTTFIRLAGCNLRCSYCDTKYSFDESKAKDMNILEIVNQCKNIGYHNITLTGGEPLMHSDATLLIIALCQYGFQVNIETNGSIDLTELLELRKERNYDLFFTVDYKCLFSKMSNQMNPLSFKGLDDEKDIVKCVVANKKDMDDALLFLDSFDKKFNIWFSPVYKEIEPVEIVEFMKKRKREDITVQVQLHKIIWDPQERGV